MIKLPPEISADLLERKIVKDFSLLPGKIGLFGGSFDPIHRIHQAIAQELLKAKIVDSIIFIPAAQNPLKSVRPTGSGDRLAMILLSIEKIENAFVSQLELERGENSYTVDTIREVSQSVNPAAKLHWIIGTDNLLQLPQWRDVEEIFSLVSVITIQRDQVRTEEQWFELIDAIDLSQSARENLKNNFVMRRPNSVSSTAVRNKVAIDSIGELVSEPVANYIRQKGLYI